MNHSLPGGPEETAGPPAPFSKHPLDTLTPTLNGDPGLRCRAALATFRAVESRRGDLPLVADLRQHAFEALRQADELLHGEVGASFIP